MLKSIQLSVIHEQNFIEPWKKLWEEAHGERQNSQIHQSMVKCDMNKVRPTIYYFKLMIRLLKFDLSKQFFSVSFR